MVVSAPVFPIRHVMARFDRKSGLFVPCAKGKGTLLMALDANGRTVRCVESHPFSTATSASGWILCEPSSMHDPEQFRVWMQANPELEITK